MMYMVLQIDMVRCGEVGVDKMDRVLESSDGVGETPSPRSPFELQAGPLYLSLRVVLADRIQMDLVQRSPLQKPLQDILKLVLLALIHCQSPLYLEPMMLFAYPQQLLQVLSLYSILANIAQNVPPSRGIELRDSFCYRALSYLCRGERCSNVLFGCFSLGLDNVSCDLFLDARGSGCVVKGCYGLFDEEGVGANAGYHQSVGVASERLFQDPCQLGVSVGDMITALIGSQQGDTVSECQQTFIDIRPFLDALVLAALDLLRPSKVYNVELGDILVPIAVLHLDLQKLQGMGSGRVHIVVGRSESSLKVPLVHAGVEITQVVDLRFEELTYNSIPFTILHNIQVFGSLAREEVSHILIVDLEETVLQLHNVISHRLDLLLPPQEILVDQVTQPLLLLVFGAPEHSVGLPRPRDSIGEYCEVKPFEQSLHILLQMGEYVRV